MDALVSRQHHSRVRVLPHIKKLDDCCGDFLVCVVWRDSTNCRLTRTAVSGVRRGWVSR